MQLESQVDLKMHQVAVHNDNSLERIINMNEKKMLSDQELVGTLYNAGFRGERLETAFAVAKAESNARPKAYNPPTNNTGDNSYGIFQINMIGDLGPDRRERYSLKRNEDLFDPDRNARIAFEMSNNGKDWGKWTTYTGGRYKEFLSDAKKALEQFKNVNINVRSPKQIEGPQADKEVPDNILSLFRGPYEEIANTFKNVASIFTLPGMNK
jgi:hypothetical protein